MNFHELWDAQYISIETYRKNGRGVRTPVWQTAEQGKLYVWTMVGSGKVKRIRNNDHVRVCRCDMSGTPLSDWVEAWARLLTGDAHLDRQRERMLDKYGQQFRQFDQAGSQRVVIEISPLEN
jgi:PPOX class probable F420-dependent enzyme